MSTTLTNGLKLPDKGSVDWYADMQSNYQILDGAVGTVAEHTTQIAGKAPLVHTHSKADITDLFKSANTWSESQTYSKAINYKTSYVLGNLPGNAEAQQAFKILESTGTDFICDIASFQNALATGLRFTTKNKMDANGFSPSGTIKAAYLHFLQNAENKGYLQWDGYTKNNVIPLTTNTYDLGSSSYQWNNLYAKNYYYNGTAWGLDKANVWSNVNTFSNTLSITGNTLFAWDRPQVTIGTIPSSIVFYGTTRFRDSNNTSYAFERGAISTTWNYRQWFVHNFSNASINASFEIGIKHDGTEKYFLIDADKVIPNTTGVSDLGTSDKKWKSLNGINPGALSLPNMDSTVSKTTELAAAIDKTQTVNSWTADFTGILSIIWYVKGLTGPFRCAVFNNADIRYATWGQTFSANDVWFFIISFPVQNGKTYYFDNSFIRTSEDTAPILYGASAVYCLGNV